MPRPGNSRSPLARQTDSLRRRVKKLIIQIPCYNEDASLAITLRALPRDVPGFAKVEWLIVNDGSEDRTVAVARENGVDHIVELGAHRGLASAFMAGLDAALRAGADVIVNTDADNQYNADDIPKLVGPILRGEAAIVVGARPVADIAHFSPLKKFLQRVGSGVVRRASGTDVADAPSGFRAMSREAAMQLNVFSRYTYTLETIIQAGQKNIPILSVPVRTNADMRPSRLVKSMRAYVHRSILTILRISVTYKPLRVFLTLGTVPFILGTAIGLRWLWYFILVEESARTRLPSLILAAILILIGVQLWIVGIVADIVAVNRRLLEDILVRVKRMEYR